MTTRSRWRLAATILLLFVGLSATWNASLSLAQSDPIPTDPPAEPDIPDAQVPIFDLTGSGNPSTGGIEPAIPDASVPLFDLTGTEPLSLSDMVLLFSDDFEYGGSFNWGMGQLLAITDKNDRHAFQYSDTVGPTALGIGNLSDFIVQMNILLQNGQAIIGFKHTGSGSYTLLLDPSGMVEMSKSGQVQRTSKFDVSSPDAWHSLYIVVAADTIRVYIDGVEVIAVLDPAPLPAGMVFVSGDFGSTYLIDDFALSVPRAQWEAFRAPQQDRPLPPKPSSNLSMETTMDVGSGNRIAFRRRTDQSQYWIYTVNSDGTNLLAVVGANTFMNNPTWSADGSLIAFDTPITGNYEIFAVSSSGGTPYQLTNNPASDGGPVWSPDGSKIAFLSDRDHGIGSGNYDITS